MTVAPVTKPPKKCPLYCTIDHRHGERQHARRIGEVDLASENAFVVVDLVRPNAVDEVALMIGEGWGEPTVALMSADEARTLRDALNVAVVLLDRT